MTFNREPLDPQEFRELCDAAHYRFRNEEIDENEYRRLLAKLGFNAVESDREVELRRPGK